MSFLLAANPLSPQIDRFGWLLLHSLWQFTLMALFAFSRPIQQPTSMTTAPA